MPTLRSQPRTSTYCVPYSADIRNILCLLLKGCSLNMTAWAMEPLTSHHRDIMSSLLRKQHSTWELPH